MPLIEDIITNMKIPWYLYQEVDKQTGTVYWIIWYIHIKNFGVWKFGLINIGFLCISDMDLCHMRLLKGQTRFRVRDPKSAQTF